MTKVNFCLSTDMGGRNLLNSQGFGLLHFYVKELYLHTLTVISVKINSAIFVCVE